MGAGGNAPDVADPPPAVADSTPPVPPLAAAGPALPPLMAAGAPEPPALPLTAAVMAPALPPAAALAVASAPALMLDARDPATAAEGCAPAPAPPTAAAELPPLAVTNEESEPCESSPDAPQPTANNPTDNNPLKKRMTSLLQPQHPQRPPKTAENKARRPAQSAPQRHNASAPAQRALDSRETASHARDAGEARLTKHEPAAATVGRVGRRRYTAVASAEQSERSIEGTRQVSRERTHSLAGRTGRANACQRIVALARPVQPSVRAVANPQTAGTTGASAHSACPKSEWVRSRET